MLKLAVEERWQEAGSGTIEIRDARPVQGGDINRCFALDTDRGAFFLKVNDLFRGRGFFQAEQGGLERLRATQAVAVPQPLLAGSTTSESYLLMEFLEKKAPAPDFWEAFASDLGRLHACTATHFGLEEDNYIGTLAQRNSWRERWGEFYVELRLRPLVRSLVDEGVFAVPVSRDAERLFSRMESIFPPEAPALLHGDLWGGNFLAGPQGRAFLFDPAVYYGCREMDLAMARLFGGFDRKFYWHYQEHFPLAEGWQQRIPLCQLYPLLVHARQFGGSYARQAADIMSGF